MSVISIYGAQDSEMSLVTIWGSPTNMGDGSVAVYFFLNENEAKRHQSNMEDGWGEDCSFPVETYVGSNVHKGAFATYEDYVERYL